MFAIFFLFLPIKNGSSNNPLIQGDEFDFFYYLPDIPQIMLLHLLWGVNFAWGWYFIFFLYLQCESLMYEGVRNPSGWKHDSTHMQQDSMNNWIESITFNKHWKQILWLLWLCKWIWCLCHSVIRRINNNLLVHWINYIKFIHF